MFALGLWLLRSSVSHADAGAFDEYFAFDHCWPGQCRVLGGGKMDGAAAKQRAAKELFDTLDSNGDGQISLGELTSAMAKLDPSLSPEAIAAIFNQPGDMNAAPMTPIAAATCA